MSIKAVSDADPVTENYLSVANGDANQARLLRESTERKIQGFQGYELPVEDPSHEAMMRLLREQSVKNAPAPGAPTGRGDTVVPCMS